MNFITLTDADTGKSLEINVNAVKFIRDVTFLGKDSVEICLGSAYIRVSESRTRVLELVELRTSSRLR